MVSWKKHLQNLTFLAVAYSVCTFLWLKPFNVSKQPFICNDPSLSREYKDTTISNMFIILYQQFIAFVIILLIELASLLTTRPDGEPVDKIKLSLRQANVVYFEYMVVWTLLVVVIEASKFWFGEHRPHFYDLCKPNVQDCVTGTYVFDYTCTNPNLTERKLRTLLTSFPSGHSALGVYFSIFLGWLLQQRFKDLKSKLLIPSLQTLLVLYAAFCCITRITDNFHHPHDVLFGAFFGAIFSIYNCIFVADNFKQKISDEPVKMD